MSDIKSAFGTNNQSVTCTITSLANNGQRQSTVIDNSTNKFIDALIQVTAKTAGSGTSSTGYIAVYMYMTADGGTTYSDGATGSDGSITLTVPPNMRLIGILNCVANSATYKGVFQVAAGGQLPEKWGIVIENKTGGALDASVGAVVYQGLYNTVL
jgi:hypothetical protein